MIFVLFPVFVNWDEISAFNKIWLFLTFFSFFILGYFHFCNHYAVFYVDEEGLKEKQPLLTLKVVSWEDLQAVKWNDRACEESNWYCRMKDFPTFIVRVCSEKGSYIEIVNYIEDYEELMERFLEECDRRGLGGKVEYKVREKVWELQDAKREEEEWEEDAWEDEEWEEEDDE